jgi:alkylresorcinol/alkylpyrone synthase
MSSAWQPGGEPATIPRPFPRRAPAGEATPRSREPRTAPAAAPAIIGSVTAVPGFSATQAEVKARLRELFDLPGRRLDAAMELFDHAGVQRRFSVEPLDRLGVPRPLGEIQDRYREHAFSLGREAAREALNQAGVGAAEIDLIVTTSCTGIMIPSLDAYLVDELGLRSDVRRLPITELGCAAGAAALARTHDFLVGFPGARALVIAVELPSLSMQRADLSLANLVATALFGDGAAAVVLAGGDVRMGGGVGAGTGSGVRILETLSHIFPRSAYALGFDLKDDGFHSVLSKDIPALLQSEIASLVGTLAGRRGLGREDLSSFVLHPGGRKILAIIEQELGLTRADTQPSWDVLRDYGNQSSASVLFVLQEWLTRRRPAAGTHGVLAAFGPGLTAEMLLLGWS